MICDCGAPAEWDGMCQKCWEMAMQWAYAQREEQAEDFFECLEKNYD